MSSQANENSQQQFQIKMETEEERLLRHIYRTDKEKLEAFSQMLRRAIMLKRAKITHK